MKISNVKNFEQAPAAAHGPEQKDNAGDKAVVFRRAISDLGAEQQRQYLTELAEKIQAQGELLAKKADISELQKYRELVGEFIKETVNNSYSFSKENALEGRRRHKVFATINKVNVKLEELAKEVLSDQKDNISLLGKVDEIRGLILDILL